MEKDIAGITARIVQQHQIALWYCLIGICWNPSSISQFFHKVPLVNDLLIMIVSLLWSSPFQWGNQIIWLLTCFFQRWPEVTLRLSPWKNLYSRAWLFNLPGSWLQRWENLFQYSMLNDSARIQGSGEDSNQCLIDRGT